LEKEGTNTADILVLVDRLESILGAGWRVPFTNKAVIDEQALLDVIDQMRIAVPDEIKQAKRITQERERFLAQAQADAEQIITEGRAKAVAMLQDRELSKSSEARAQVVVDEAKKEAARIRNEADVYSLGVLSDLLAEVTKQQQTAQNGVDVLRRRLAS
jgi:cell division septum initiation protein DivIVA